MQLVKEPLPLGIPLIPLRILMDHVTICNMQDEALCDKK